MHIANAHSENYKCSTGLENNIWNRSFKILYPFVEWWSNAIEEDSFYSSLPFDASESGLWNGRFVPPPPRPPFWDDTVTPDGLTTCDLCTWALQDRNAFSIDGTISGEYIISASFYWCLF